MSVIYEENMLSYLFQGIYNSTGFDFEAFAMVTKPREAVHSNTSPEDPDKAWLLDELGIATHSSICYTRLPDSIMNK